MLIDGHGGVGQVLAAYASCEAVRRAKAHGVGVVGVRDSNHFGTAAYFTRMAALDSCIGILTTNASPAMAPWGGRRKTVGTKSVVDSGTRRTLRRHGHGYRQHGRRAGQDLSCAAAG
jgi:LDH2 family malate/lactate/ureidoglycolate dehydrogenase